MTKRVVLGLDLLKKLTEVFPNLPDTITSIDLEIPVDGCVRVTVKSFVEDGTDDKLISTLREYTLYEVVKESEKPNEEKII